MTLEDIEKNPKEFLTVTDIAPYLHSSPSTLRIQAREWPELLGFPVVIVGRRVKIPKTRFVQYFRGPALHKQAASGS